MQTAVPERTIPVGQNNSSLRRHTMGLLRTGRDRRTVFRINQAQQRPVGRGTQCPLPVVDGLVRTAPLLQAASYLRRKDCSS